nr:sugar transferase [Lachnospiraceae bacterium]
MVKLLYRILKRFFDIVSSLLAVLVTLPLWLIIAAGIKLSSKGPVFYKSERIGKNRKPFTLYKFRSMHVYHAEPGSGQNREAGALVNTDRIFKFGKLLRKSKLDELAQLLNILIGDMSVIGPRPLTAAGVKRQYSGEYESILTVRPGLACLDSLYDYVHGELVVTDNEEFMQKVMPVRRELARTYVEKRNVGLDVYCIGRTLKLIFQVIILRKKDFPFTKYEAEAQKRVESRNASGRN